jgi:hypothetical protein
LENESAQTKYVGDSSTVKHRVGLSASCAHLATPARHKPIGKCQRQKQSLIALSYSIWGRGFRMRDRLTASCGIHEAPFNQPPIGGNILKVYGKYSKI